MKIALATVVRALAFEPKSRSYATDATERHRRACGGVLDVAKGQL